MYVMHLGQRDTELGDNEYAYLNALGGNIHPFANALQSDHHGHLSSLIEREASRNGLSMRQVIDQMNMLHAALAETDLDEAKAIRLLEPGLNNDHALAVKTYYYVKFMHAVGQVVIAHGLQDLMLQEPGDPMVDEAREHLGDVLAEMKYHPWTRKVMLERLDNAIEQFSAGYLGGRQR